MFSEEMLCSHYFSTIVRLVLEVVNIPFESSHVLVGKVLKDAFLLLICENLNSEFRVLSLS